MGQIYVIARVSLENVVVPGSPPLLWGISFTFNMDGMQNGIPSRGGRFRHGPSGSIRNHCYNSAVSMAMSLGKYNNVYKVRCVNVSCTRSKVSSGYMCMYTPLIDAVLSKALHISLCREYDAYGTGQNTITK